MEGCKERALDAGLRFQDETLEYIVTNRDLLELTPKHMIPTMYDYWVHDVEVLKEKGRYELYPDNPYETVINTRPPISFYNDNNPDWLNVMIFYHVLGHIDFFQNNLYFKHTWDEDFAGRALSDKRLIAMLRSEKGRWVDYLIEFTRGMDNLVGYYAELSSLNRPPETGTPSRLDYYFDTFLQQQEDFNVHKYLKEIDRYNDLRKEAGDMSEVVFFSRVVKTYPEFESRYDKFKKGRKERPKDTIQYILNHSSFLKKEKNKWMRSVIEIVRHTSLFFQPQIRTKIMNEGWASYWHDTLFLRDDRIKGNEVGYARINAKVTALPRVGLNPYALGMRLFAHIEDMAEKGRMTWDFQRIKDARERDRFDKKTGTGRAALFQIRENLSDFTFVQTFVDQDFVDRHKLFVTGKRLNNEKGVWEYYVKSRSAEAYRDMLLESLYHPPHVEIREDRGGNGVLYLDHRFEGKLLIREFIPNTLLGIEYLWGGPVKLETSEWEEKPKEPVQSAFLYTPYQVAWKEKQDEKPKIQRVLYTMENRRLSREVVDSALAT
jgi:stage V sporulation protein R